MNEKQREKQETAYLTAAVKEIRKSDNLRFLLRQVFYLTGTEDAAVASDTNTMMQMIGRQSVGAELKSLLASYDATLYAELVLEDAKYFEQLNKPQPKDDDDV